MRSEEGQPIGNGRMGSLVWTTPSALHFQINRVDVFGQNSYTTSFPKQDTDYASGCGYVDVNLTDADDNLLAGDSFHQHLSIYDALMTVAGKGLSAHRGIREVRRDCRANRRRAGNSCGDSSRPADATLCNSIRVGQEL